MTPSLPDILRGGATCLLTPPEPESGGEFMAGRVGVVALLNLLAAQELEKAPLLDEENRAMEQLIGRAGEGSTPQARNADLRRALIAHHEALEARGEDDRAILHLYRVMADRWRLDLPALPAG